MCTRMSEDHKAIFLSMINRGRETPFCTLARMAMDENKALRKRVEELEAQIKQQEDESETITYYVPPAWL